MNKILQIPFTLRGISNTIEVIYKSNDSVSESGFDALPDLPFNPNLCIGYPVMQAYIKDMANTGYRRQCGWIQLVKRNYFSSDMLDKPDENNLSVDSPISGSIFSAFGTPAEVYDAPCNNLNGNARGMWTAYTYLVDYPTRMNGYKIIYLAGFQWGYEESLINGELTVNIQDIKKVDQEQWKEHILFLKNKYPQYDYI